MAPLQKPAGTGVGLRPFRAHGHRGGGLLLALAMFSLASLFGQANSVSSPAGMAAQLSGTNYVRTTWVGDAFYSFTFEIWFKAAGPGVLLGEVHAQDAAQWDHALAEILPSGEIRTAVPGVEAITFGPVTFGSWHHLALVYDDTSKAFAAYVNGAPAGVSQGQRLMPDARQYNYCIGRGGPTNLGAGGFLAGTVDEVRLWNRALSASEIAFQFNKVINVEDHDLRYNWHFDILVAGRSHLSPGTIERHEAMHMPQKPFQLVASTAPVVNDPRPSIVSVNAEPVASGAVDLKGRVNPNGSVTSVYFEYAQGANAAERTAPRQIGQGSEAVAFVEVVTGLQVAAGYNYWLVDEQCVWRREIRNAIIRAGELGWVCV